MAEETRKGQGFFDLEVSEDDKDVAYLRMPGHPGKIVHGIIKRTERLHELIGAYDGPDVYFHFDANDTLISIELLA